jgi:hypothetical protein
VQVTLSTSKNPIDLFQSVEKKYEFEENQFTKNHTLEKIYGQYGFFIILDRRN